MLTLERTGVSLGSGIGSPALVPDVHKIAVLRANGLGDFIVALPALEALRAAYPRADIALLAKDWQVGFLSGRPGPVDRVIVVPPVRGISVAEDGPEGEGRAIEEFFATMRAEHFDLAIQLHGGGRNSNPFVRRLGARVAAGLKTPDAVALDRWIPYNLYQPEILRYCEVMSLVGALPRTLAPGISVTPRDLAESLRVVPPTDKPLVAIHPGATDPRRWWPPESFARVADALACAGAELAIIGTDVERRSVEGVLGAMSAPAWDTSGQLSLGGLAGLLSRCRMVVGNDSGPLHLAQAVGAATVGIYWAYNLMNYGPFTRSRHHPLVSWCLDCPVCHRRLVGASCEHRVSLVTEVSVEDVRTAALDLFHATADEQTRGVLLSSLP